MAAVPEAELERRAAAAPPALDPRPHSASQPGVAVIAEVKRSSPSKGALADIPDPAALAAVVRRRAARPPSACSPSSAGSAAASTTSTRCAPRCDSRCCARTSWSTRYQVTEARAHGADLVLLIVAALDNATCVDLHEHARDARHDRARRGPRRGRDPPRRRRRRRRHRRQRPRPAGPSRSTPHGVRPAPPRIPDGVVTVAESGVRGVDDVAAYARGRRRRRARRRGAGHRRRPGRTAVRGLQRRSGSAPRPHPARRSVSMTTHPTRRHTAASASSAGATSPRR